MIEDEVKSHLPVMAYVLEMTLKESNGYLRLDGKTRSFYHKQIAGVAVMAVLRRLNVKLQFDNGIEVFE